MWLEHDYSSSAILRSLENLSHEEPILSSEDTHSLSGIDENLPKIKFKNIYLKEFIIQSI